ncbi:MAG: DNA mismatch repair protein, partial [Halobacteria archaeon]|nr:DNA mismatch repair protein [Halobacteria archaeon]
MNAIESADIRALTEAGLTRGRATRIVRRAKGGEGLDVLATRDTREVYKNLLNRISEFAVTDNAADRISVMTPFVEKEDAEERLERVYDIIESWESLDGDERDELLDAFAVYDVDGGTRKAAVEASLRIKDSSIADAFPRFDELDDAALEDALDSLTYLDDSGSETAVREGADERLDEVREKLSGVEEMEDSAFDVLEDIRSASTGIQGVDALQEEFADYVLENAGVDYARVQDSAPSDAADATDFITQSLRNLTSQLRDEVAEEEERVKETLEESIEENADEIDTAVAVVDETAFLVSLARFSAEYDLTRPDFIESGVGVKNARNIELVASAGS